MQLRTVAAVLGVAAVAGAVVAVTAVAVPGLVPTAGLDLATEAAPDAESPPPLAFREVAADAGLDYEGGRGAATGDRGQLDNEGVYVTDYDGDGWQDVLAVGGSEPVLFENVGGRFEPSGALPTGAFDAGAVTAALFFDRDGDGDDDLLLLA